MNDTSFRAACAALVDARRTARRIDVFPAAWQPADIAEGYRLQKAVADTLGAVGGWKVGAVTPEQRRAQGVDRPIGGALLAPWLRDARSGAATFRAAEFIVPKLECELAFELARDLPARPQQPYTREEVQAAVKCLRIGIEVVDSRLPAGTGTLAELADACNNGAYVAGADFADWTGIDFAQVGIVLTRTHEGASSEVATGSGAAILDGDPFGTVVMLANAPPGGRPGLRAGDIVTTGSCTGAPPLPGPGSYRAEFSGLGSVEVRFTADAS
jgi:2-keto-4-pentenoate hydratase